MATSKKPRPIERTVHALPMPDSLDQFASLHFTHKSKPYSLTLTVNITNDPSRADSWSRQVAWTHRSSDFRSFATPQRVEGFLAPSEFVLRGAGSRIEFTLDVKRNASGNVEPIITEFRNRRSRTGSATDRHFPAELPPLTVLEAKAARLAFVAGLATAPGEYRITEFARGTTKDVKNHSKHHAFPFRSREALELFAETYDPDLWQQSAKAEAERIARETGRSPGSVHKQERLAREQGLIQKLPKKGKRT